MTRIALGKELQILKNLITDMAKNVDEMVNGTILALNKLDATIAEKVIKADDQIDYYEHMVCQTALEIIALQQPVARDLRFVITAIDIARNLERTADQSVNIAYSALTLSKQENRAFPECKVAIEEMANEALTMLHSAINAFVTENTQKARSVIEYDSIVDRLQRDLIEDVKNCMKRSPNNIDPGIEYIKVIENIERIADLATNIAEGVIFVTEGRMVKLEERTISIKNIKEEILKDLPVFELLRKHARLVIECVERLSLSLEAYYNLNQERLEETAKHIFEIEKEADKLKRNIRGHLPKGLILPVERFELFMYLKEQDAIADVAEEILNWLSFKHLPVSSDLFKHIEELLNQSIKPLEFLEEMILYSADFILTKNEESRNRAKDLIREIRYGQYLAEDYGNKVKKAIFNQIEDPLALFYFLKLVDLILGISHHAENTADLMRAMIAK
ncbi:phosphate signaling complex protein PhoU [Thermodesulfobacterium sp. TA1]|uniref:phosphate signaling complex protein PhoU n=1 Tax=Thermodesulfobacterium sp. TA1 TaxID=2234087 RepID=UPI001232BC40|nr:phosphate signaling complex protein PhoU [Thermodesulfobacterium sp. TA1]QER42224.1 phosphate signaling complex protein PhoU [Thermodesulfobacterium sp. TA1]